MATRIEIGLRSTVPDARGQAVAARAQGYFGISIPKNGVRTRDVYLIDAKLSTHTLKEVRQAFTDPVTATSKLGRLHCPKSCTWIIEVSFKPGVTDNLARTAQVVLADVLDRPLKKGEQIYTGTQYLIEAPKLTREQADLIGRKLLANSLIQNISVFSCQEWAAHPIDTTPPVIIDPAPPVVRERPLDGSDDDLMRISRDGILSLSLEEMQAIRTHYSQPDVQQERQAAGLPQWPTDIELECLAQTWSEHCSHKIFSARIRYTDDQGNTRTIEKGLYKEYIQRATKEVSKQRDWLVSVFTDNAGIVRFNDHLNLVFKAETHNSPSALDPYGGSITGIVGVNRDPMGTGMGAELLCNTWGYCLGSPFYDGEIPEGLMHPRRIRDGVHAGVIDGGNQSGIPYGRGFECFDERFIGKPLVYCGTIGSLPAKVNGRPSERKEVEPGDLVIMAGGRIGKDGIHGATFSSEELRGESPAQAVQIGDALTQRKLYEFILEARDLGLYRAITDNGAGGLSSSAGEMAELSGGLDIDVGRAPLKYEGLQPWEIFLSEAQERMTLAVPPESKQALFDLAARRDVEITDLGTFTNSGKLIIRYHGKISASLSMDFLHDGCPRLDLEARWTPPQIERFTHPSSVGRSRRLLKLLGSLDICSNEERSRHYDHEVKGRSIVKPWIGVEGDVPSDASVLLAEYDRPEGFIVTEGIAPYQSDLDAGAMAASVLDLAVRRILSAGGELNFIAGLDNFCWPDPVQTESNPDGAYKLAQLVRANEKLFDTCVAYGVPLISGKDSMKNDSVRGGRRISIPPTLLLSALGRISDVKRAVTIPFKQAGDLILVAGWTHEELGASALYRQIAAENGCPEKIGGTVPGLCPEETLPLYRALEQAMQQGLIESSRALAQGGLAVSLALCALGGHLGANVSTRELPRKDQRLTLDAQLFGESNGRFLLTAKPENKAALMQLFDGLPLKVIGKVTDDGLLHIRNDSGLEAVKTNLTSLRTSYRNPLRSL